MTIVQSKAAAPTRLAAITRPAHGLDNRGLEGGAIPGMGYGRFGRMFPFSGNLLPDACLRDIADSMIKVDVSKPIIESEGVDENPAVPAGYTYFGQFIDHDLTLDPTPLKARNVDIAALEDFRTPALDLDCVYGSGPDDQPYMYEADGLHLRLGRPLTSGGAARGNRRDLLRLFIDGEAGARAIIGDKRNDENRLVAQLQSLFISFHNKVVDDHGLITAAGGIFSDDTSRFRTAVNIVRWHYQWLVVNDFLKRLLEPNIVADILGDGVPDLRHYEKQRANYAYIPVEFAGAAYRVGHSMVRPGYSLNSAVVTTPPDRNTRPVEARDGRIPIFSDSSDPLENLNAFGVPVPSTWGIDWAFFFDNVVKAETIPPDFKLPQPSYRLDAQLVQPLTNLPEFKDAPQPFRHLAYRNLVRGVVNLRLPSGEQVAHALRIEPLGPDILWSAGSRTLSTATLDKDARGDISATNDRRKAVSDTWVHGRGDEGRVLNGNTPLWYYILREAEYYGTDRVAEGANSAFGGQYLGPVGSRILAETVIGLLWNDEMSYLRRWPDFKPMEQIAGKTGSFTVGHLINWVLA